MAETGICRNETLTGIRINTPNCLVPVFWCLFFSEWLQVIEPGIPFAKPTFIKLAAIPKMPLAQPSKIKLAANGS
jgi:hypothetical protein